MDFDCPHCGVDLIDEWITVSANWSLGGEVPIEGDCPKCGDGIDGVLTSMAESDTADGGEP